MTSVLRNFKENNSLNETEHIVKKEKFYHASPLPQGWLPAVSSWSPPRLKVPPIWRNLLGRRPRTPPPPPAPLPKLRSSKVLESLSPTQTRATGYWFHISLSHPFHNSRWFGNLKSQNETSNPQEGEPRLRGLWADQTRSPQEHRGHPRPVPPGFSFQN